MHTAHPAASPVPASAFARMIVTLAALASLGATSILGPAAPVWPAHVIALLAALFVALLARALAPGPVAALAWLVPALQAASLLGLPWQGTMAIALVTLALLSRVDRLSSPGRAAFALGPVPWLGTLATAGVTPIALALWYGLARPDLRDVLDAYVPALPFAVLVLGGVLFAVVNAALEELLWRGVFFHGIERAFGSSWSAVAITALSFGVAHAHGFPRGVIGVVLVTSWGLMLGWLRRETKGLLAPFLAHVVADAVIAVIVLGIARGLW